MLVWNNAAGGNKDICDSCGTVTRGLSLQDKMFGSSSGPCLCSIAILTFSAYCRSITTPYRYAKHGNNKRSQRSRG